MKRKHPPQKSSKPFKKHKKSIYKNYGGNVGFMSMLKRIDTSNATVPFTLNTTLQGILLNPIAGGDNFYSRDGTRVRYKSLEFRGDIYCAPQSTGFAEADCLRIIIVYDKTPNGGAPVWSNVVQDTAGNSTTIAPLNHGTRQRFCIIMDKTIRVKPFSATVAAAVPTFTSIGPMPLELKPEIIHEYKKFNFELDSTWIDGSAAVASLESGGFFLFVQSADFSAMATPWFLNYSTSLLYTDTPIKV